eukprot:UN14217
MFVKFSSGEGTLLWWARLHYQMFTQFSSRRFTISCVRFGTSSSSESNESRS